VSYVLGDKLTEARTDRSGVVLFECFCFILNGLEFACSTLQQFDAPDDPRSVISAAAFAGGTTCSLSHVLMGFDPCLALFYSLLLCYRITL
jgi:hypothetical protein